MRRRYWLYVFRREELSSIRVHINTLVDTTRGHGRGAGVRTCQMLRFVKCWVKCGFHVWSRILTIRATRDLGELLVPPCCFIPDYAGRHSRFPALHELAVRAYGTGPPGLIMTVDKLDFTFCIITTADTDFYGYSHSNLSLGRNRAGWW
jgi:hypothetical protein